ncbi:transposase [Paenibacillus larvae]|nr:transposase [Paenibacillus larvae]MDT2264423.1 transposase [Paenibacillus larvae]
MSFSALKRTWITRCGSHYLRRSAGLVRAVRQQLQGVTWQRCQTHFTRNVLEASPKALKDEIHGRLRSILDAPDTGTARFLLKQTLAAYEDKAGKAMGVLESGFDDATAVLMLPERCPENGCARQIALSVSTKGVRRRERVIRIFPNRESVIRLIGALLMEQDEKWAADKISRHDRVHGMAEGSAKVRCQSDSHIM